MRRVTSTAPTAKSLCWPVAVAYGETCAAITATATVLPVVNRNCRRFGSGGSEEASSFASVGAMALLHLPAIAVTWIVLQFHVIDPHGTDGIHLPDLLTRLRPMKVRRIAGQHDYGTWWIRLQFVGVELIAEADVEDA